jgi:succinate dehydrogenase hydrophobic anchor subunit
VNNPFRILIVIAAVIAVAFFVGFIYIVFIHPNGNPQGLGSVVAALGSTGLLAR